LNRADAMGSIQNFEGVSVKIKPNGSVGSVVDYDPDWPTKSRQHIYPSRQLLPDTIESLLDVTPGATGWVEVNAQESINPDERSHEQRLGSLVLGDNDRMRDKSGSPCSLLGP
jgi:hypothetical protein